MFDDTAANANVPAPSVRAGVAGSYRVRAPLSDGALASLDRWVASFVPGARLIRSHELVRIARKARHAADSDLHVRLGRAILAGRARGDDFAAALAAVSVAAQQDSRAARDDDLAAAAGLLRGLLVETDASVLSGPAVTLAAAAAAVAHVRVHVLCPDARQVTARTKTLRPIAKALGFSVDEVVPEMSARRRSTAYRADVVCTTVEQVALDYLRDRRSVPRATGANWYKLSSLRRAASLSTSCCLQGLPLAIVDGAQAILLDKAVRPVALHQRSDAYDEVKMAATAYELAENLVSDEDFRADQDGGIQLLDPGCAKLEAWGMQLQGLWNSRGWREAAVKRVLAARHRWREGDDYAVVEGRVVAQSSDFARALEAEREVPGLDTVIRAAHGVLPRGTPVAHVLCYRVLSGYCRLGALGLFFPGFAREAGGRYGLSAARIRGTGDTPRIPGKCRVFPTAQARGIALAEADQRARRRGDKVVLVNADATSGGSLAEQEPEDRTEGRGGGGGLSLPSLHRRETQVIVTGAEECIALDAEEVVRCASGSRVHVTTLLTRSELTSGLSGRSVATACSWILAGTMPSLAGLFAGMALRGARQRRRRLAAQQRGRALRRRRAARRALAFVEDVES